MRPCLLFKSLISCLLFINLKYVPGSLGAGVGVLAALADLIEVDAAAPFTIVSAFLPSAVKEESPALVLPPALRALIIPLSAAALFSPKNSKDSFKFSISSIS